MFKGVSVDSNGDVMKSMLALCTCMVFLTTSVAFGQQELPPRMATALAKYQAIEKAARAEFIASLESQLKDATRARNAELVTMTRDALEFVKREETIPKDYPLLRKRLDGTKWSWEKHDRKTGMTLVFHEDGNYDWQERGNERTIEYRTVSPHSVLHGDGQGQFLFDFDLTKFVYIDLKKDTVRTGTRIK